MNLDKVRNKSIFILPLFVLAILSASIFFRLNAPSRIQKSSDELSCAEQDRVEAAKDAWGKMLTSHPFYTRPHRNEEERNEQHPAEDGPDLAAELDFMKTMDPALGAVPHERLIKANQEVDKELKNRAGITGFTWVERGPTNVGGRTRALMFDPNDPTHKKVWAGGSGGGLWFTNDITVATPVWTRVNDLWANIAVTCIAYNPFNPQEYYVGTGEGFTNYDYQEGSGMYKSSNGGTTWVPLGNTSPGAYNSASDFHYIQKIAIKPNGTIFAATKGYYINSGGIMRSTDGGTNWSKVLTVYTGSGSLYDWANDIEIAANGDTYASFGINSTGKIFKSKDSNNGIAGSWNDKSTAIGIANAQRIEIACAPSDFHYVYAVAHGGSGMNDIEWCKRSIDSGATWTALAIPRLVDDGTTHFTAGQAWYDLILAVHPTNPNIVLAGGRDLHRTINGGTSWTPISQYYGGFGQPYVHADQHNIMFRPTLSNEAVFVNDGGVFYSPNAGNSGVTPTFVDKNTGYDVTQLYSCAAKNEFNSNYFLAGAQDNQTQKFTQPQASPTSIVIGGDGGFCQIDQLDADFQVGESIYNNISMTWDDGANWYGMIAESTGLFINPNDYDNTRKILYAAAGNDAVKRVSNLSDQNNIGNTDITISVGAAMVAAVKCSPYNDVVFLGIVNSRIYKLSSASTGSPTLTRIDNGATPITSAGYVSNIDLGIDDNHILATYSNYGVMSIWQTTDGGAHWYNKEGNIPDVPVRWAIYNPNNREQVLAATELGIWTTDNFGSTTTAVPVWAESSPMLAHTRCDMIKFRPADNVVTVATHGRGLFTSEVFVANSVADFTSDVIATCAGSLTVHFFDASLKPNGTWAWDVDGNGTTDFTTQNCTKTYSTPGSYTVTLKVNSGNTTITKTNYIVVTSSAPLNTGCTVGANMNNGNGAAIGIHRFKLNAIDNYTSYNDGPYHDYACANAAALDLNTTYNVTVQTGYLNVEGAKFYIDFNNDGAFADPAESIVSFPVNLDGTRTLPFTTPVTGVVTRKSLRARIISAFAAIPGNACDVGTYGQAEDYSVYFNCTLLVTLTSGTLTGSLPAAINCANPGDTIRISASLANQSILIGSSPLTLPKNLVFIGLGANTNITTASASQIFTVNAGVNAEFQNLIITAGTSLTSGAILNNGNLKLNNVNIHRNTGVSNATLIRNTPGATNTMVGMSFIWN